MRKLPFLYLCLIAACSCLLGCSAQPPAASGLSEAPKKEPAEASAVVVPVSQEEKPPANRPADEPATDQSWTALFNGKDLTGWKYLPGKSGAWKVQDGTLVSGGPMSHLFSERGDYENFHLRVEAQINAKGDSGVVFRSEFGLNKLSHGATGSFPKGYEAQILLSGPAKKPLTGSLIDFAPVYDQLVKPDKWLTLEVIAQGQHIIIKIDGTIVVAYTDEKHTYAKGHFALQHCGAATVVKFRKVEVKELAADGPVVAKAVEPTPPPEVAKPVAAKPAPPPVMDLCKYQTAIRNQGGRDTCPYFPPVAALEAAYARKGVKVDLSTEYLVWVRNVTAEGDNKTRDKAENLCSTVGGGSGIWILDKYAVCPERDMPYQTDEPRAAMQAFGLANYDWSKPFSQFLLNRWNFDPGVVPPKARANAKYGIDKFVTLSSVDRANPRKYEEILASEHEIVFAINLHGGGPAAPGDPVWRLNPAASADSLNHFMLIVGYDHPRHFFIVKNQWGPTTYSTKTLNPEWKDVVKYNGYTLVDYNYLMACTEAHYITEVAPVGSPRFVAQRALGQWQVSFKQEDKTLTTGVLVWRRLPNNAGLKPPDLRIGDLVTKDGKQFRVNAKLDGDGTKPYQATVYIDFNTGALPAGSTEGTVWKGTLTLPEGGDSTLKLSPFGGAKQTLWGVPAAEVQISATQVGDHNLLKALPLPPGTDPGIVIINGR